MKWINILLLLFIGFYLLFLFNMNTLYLEDPTIQIKLDDVDFNIKGDLINRFFNQFGIIAIFVAGAKLAASFLAKKNLSIPSKLLSFFVGGASFTLGYEVFGAGAGILKGKNHSNLENNTINISVDNIQIITDKNNAFTGDNISVNKLESFLPRFKDSNINLGQYNSKIKEFLNNNNKLNLNPKSNIISSIEKYKSQTISEIYPSQESVTENVPNIINAPLELTDAEKLNYISDLVYLLQYNLLVNLSMVYLTFTLIFIITVKIITDNNINIEIVKKLPLGKFLYIILNKLISSWRINNIAWTYFMLISLFILSSISTFGIYVCLVVLS